MKTKTLTIKGFPLYLLLLVLILAIGWPFWGSQILKQKEEIKKSRAVSAVHLEYKAHVLKNENNYSVQIDDFSANNWNGYVDFFIYANYDFGPELLGTISLHSNTSCNCKKIKFIPKEQNFSITVKAIPQIY
jgi:hypothetical protein